MKEVRKLNNKEFEIIESNVTKEKYDVEHLSNMYVYHIQQAEYYKSLIDVAESAGIDVSKKLKK